VVTQKILNLQKFKKKKKAFMLELTSHW